MNSNEVFEGLRNSFGEAGFNLVVKIKSGEYDIASNKGNSHGFVKGAKSIILAGFAGGAFWTVFNRFLDNNPGFREKHEDLIDNYSKLIFSRISAILDEEKGIFHKTVFPFGEDALAIDFLKLAMLGGVGVPSILGILINPEYGTWISLRGAIITNLEFDDYDLPLEWFDPCPSCPKPCITACPANTVSDKGWDWESCMKFRISFDTCSQKCASRIACPYGQKHMYMEDQIAYHHKFVIKSVKEYYKNKGKN